MLSKTRQTIAVALAAAILGVSPALAVSATGDLRGENAASLSATGHDLRGENAAGLSESVAPPADDRRGPDAREPNAQPVVVEVTQPAGGGFDWTAAIIGMGAGLALAVLAGVGVAGGRRRPSAA
jgi:hypothetical protein